MDRALVNRGKTHGDGVCVYIRYTWCWDAVVICKHCSPLAEFMIIRCRPFYLAGEFTTILLVAVYIPPTHNSSDRDAALREDRQHIQMASPSSPEISIMLISRLSFQNFTSMLIVNLNPWTDYRVVKSSPFQWTPWDLWDRKLYMGFNGHKAIIFWSQSLYALVYTNVVCGFKIYFFMLRV